MKYIRLQKISCHFGRDSCSGTFTIHQCSRYTRVKTQKCCFNSSSCFSFLITYMIEIQTCKQDIKNPLTTFVLKFWEGQKIWKKISHSYLQYLLPYYLTMSGFFLNVAFSDYINNFFLFDSKVKILWVKLSELYIFLWYMLKKLPRSLTLNYCRIKVILRCRSNQSCCHKYQLSGC